MQVGRNLTYERDNTWRKIVVSLGWNDLVQLVEDKKVAGYHVGTLAYKGETEEAGLPVTRLVIIDDQSREMPTLIAYKVLQAYCDILAWSQIAVEGGAAEEYAKERIRECLDRAKIISF